MSAYGLYAFPDEDLCEARNWLGKVFDILFENVIAPIKAECTISLVISLAKLDVQRKD